MIQINLLPDVKLQFLKTQRLKRFVFMVSAIVAGSAIALVVLMALHVYVNQAFHTSRLQSDIDQKIEEYTSIDNLDTILTVREQLLEIPYLHDGKPAVTRLPDYLAKLVTNKIKLNELSLDFNEDKLRLTGRGESTKEINKFADILKNAVYTTGEGVDPVKVFSGVEFDIGVKGEEGVTFEAKMDVDQTIFDIANEAIEISVPTITSTQSFIRSDSLFDVIEEEPSDE